MAGDVRSGRGPILLAFVIAAGALLHGGCDLSSHGQKTPFDYPHHSHPAIVRFRAVNWEAETVGIESISLFTRSAGVCRTGWSFVFPLESAAVFPLRRGDTTAVVCSGRVVHFTGHQRLTGGDTTHLGRLDAHPDWTCQMSVSGERPVLSDGRRAIVRPGNSAETGDTLFPGEPWIVELEFDMSGAFSRIINGQLDTLVVNGEKVRSRQVRE
jgi:hypothetical protein